MLFSAQIEGDKCFQILGFDILLDKKCKPYIIEITAGEERDIADRLLRRTNRDVQ